MRKMKWAYMVMLVPGLLSAEAEIQFYPSAFPMYWQDEALPAVTAVVLEHNANQYHQLTALVLGPMGIPNHFNAIFQADGILNGFGSFLELRLSIGCNDEVREYTIAYEPYQLMYFPGTTWPVEVVFPIAPLELCPPYPLDVEVSVFEGHTYALFSNHEECTWNEAKRIAHALDSKVVSIGDEAENQFVQSLLLDLPAWIGLSYEETEATWTWPDSSALSYNNWAEGYPDTQDSTANHVLMGLDGTWTNADSLGFQDPAHVLLEWPFEWPIVIDDLSISYQGQYLNLNWSVPNHVDPSQIFEVHFSRDPYFEISSATLIGETTGTEFAVPMAWVSGSQGWFKLAVDSVGELQD